MKEEGKYFKREKSIGKASISSISLIDVFLSHALSKHYTWKKKYNKIEKYKLCNSIIIII